MSRHVDIHYDLRIKSVWARGVLSISCDVLKI